LVLASPPRLVSVVVTPASFFSDFHALPVLVLTPPAASSPLLHTVRPRALVVHSAIALEENTIKVKMIIRIRIAISSYTVLRK